MDWFFITNAVTQSVAAFIGLKNSLFYGIVIKTSFEKGCEMQMQFFRGKYSVQL